MLVVMMVLMMAMDMVMVMVMMNLVSFPTCSSFRLLDGRARPQSPIFIVVPLVLFECSKASCNEACGGHSWLQTVVRVSHKVAAMSEGAIR